MENKVGIRIKKLREKQSLTTSRLSEMSGVAQSTISQIENGKRNASIGTAAKIAEALNVPISEIIGGDGIKEAGHIEIKKGEKLPDVFTIENGTVRIYAPRDYIIRGKTRNIIISTVIEDDNLKEFEKGAIENFPALLEEAAAKRVINEFLNKHSKEIINEINKLIRIQKNKLQQIFSTREEETFTNSSQEDTIDNKDSE